jgi:hypothetical protein
MIDPDDQLAAARGIAFGLCLSGCIWLVIGALLWMWLS